MVVPQVVLPRMETVELVALALALKTAYQGARRAQVLASQRSVANHVAPATRLKHKKHGEEPATVVEAPTVIPPTVAGSMSRLSSAATRLAQARSGAHEAAERSNAALRRDAVRKVQRAWTLLRRQLRVWDDAHRFEALDQGLRTSLARVFGARWDRPVLRGSARAVWMTAHQTLEAMKREHLDALIQSLGGGDLLSMARNAVDDAGAVCGMTSEPVANDRAAPVRALIAQLQDCVRDYVVKVHGTSGPEVPGSAQLASRLLAPFEDVRSLKHRTRRVAASVALTSVPANESIPPARTGTLG